MQRHFLSARTLLPALVAGGLLAAGLSGAHAASPAASSAVPVQAENAWIPQPPPGADVAAAYFTLHNTGRKPAVLVGAACPAARGAMLHESSVVKGESIMRPVPRLTIRPGQSVTLKPGGLHLMLEGLEHPLAVGQQVPLELRFADGKDIRVSARVRPLGSQ